MVKPSGVRNVNQQNKPALSLYAIYLIRWSESTSNPIIINQAETDQPILME